MFCCAQKLVQCCSNSVVHRMLSALHYYAQQVLLADNRVTESLSHNIINCSACLACSK